MNTLRARMRILVRRFDLEAYLRERMAKAAERGAKDGAKGA